MFDNSFEITFGGQWLWLGKYLIPVQFDGTYLSIKEYLIFSLSSDPSTTVP
jgi:hypothetical protein